MSTEAEIVAAEEKLTAAMLASHLAVLDDLLAPGLIFTDHAGRLVSKEEDLGAYRSGLLRIDELQSSERKVLTLGECAVVSVRVQLRGTYAGHPASGDFRFTRLWARQDSKWRVIAAHSGLIAAPNP